MRSIEIFSNVSSCEEIERDNQDNSVDSNHGKLGGAESHLSTGGGGERPGGGPMWSNLLQQMGTFPPVMGVNPLGIVEPNMNPLMVCSAEDLSGIRRQTVY